MRPLACSLTFLAACSGHGTPGMVLDVSGPEGRSIGANAALDVLVLPVAADGISGTAVVDTGSPIVVLDPSAFVGASLPDGSGTVSTLSVGALSIAAPTVVGGNLIESPDPTIPVGGSLGCGVLCAFVVGLDYRDGTVTLGASQPPSNLAPPATVSFTLEGGGTTMLEGVPGNVDFPPSRIVLATTVEGAPYTFVLDSGSGTILLRQALFTQLVADGRGVIDGIGTASVGAESTSSVTRVRSFVVANADVDGPVAASDPSLEASLDSLASEIGHDVDGLIGGSYLRHFYVTIDYPDGQLSLAAYTSGAPTYDSFDRVGVAVAPSSTSVAVAQVFAGTDAASKGVAVGDVILSVDGTSLSGLGQTAIDAALSGPVGSSRLVQFGTAASASLAMQSVEIAVDDLLPL